MLEAHIPVQVRHNTITSKATDHTISLYFVEADPMVYTFHFTDMLNYTRSPRWYGGRQLFQAAALANKHAGMGQLRIGPLTAETTMLHLTTPRVGQCFVAIPTQPLRKFVISTLDKVSPTQEQVALETYIDKWVDRVLR